MENEHITCSIITPNNSVISLSIISLVFSIYYISNYYLCFQLSLSLLTVNVVLCSFFSWESLLPHNLYSFHWDCSTSSTYWNMQVISNTKIWHINVPWSLGYAYIYHYHLPLLNQTTALNLRYLSNSGKLIKLCFVENIEI